MKNLMFLLLLSGLFLFSCSKKEDINLFCPDVTSICDAIPIDDKAVDMATVEAAINKLASDLAPVPTSADPIGQEANLDMLIQRLDDCDCMKATFGCYACMESFPAQSRIDIVVEKENQKLNKSMRIFTSETKPLYFGWIN